MPSTSISFRPGWKLTLFTFALLPLLISLGFWQLAREDEKRALQAVYEARQAMAPASLSELAALDDLEYRRVMLRGRYDNERAFLLDNRIHQGRAGYEVISPFFNEDGAVVLVNRGWLPGAGDRSIMPEIPAALGDVALRGEVYVPPGATMMLGEEEAFRGWPRVLQAIDTQRMARELELIPGQEAFPYTVRLAAAQPGVLVRDWPLVSTEPEKHRAYAVQWFTMATALVALFVYAGLRGAPRGNRDDTPNR